MWFVHMLKMQGEWRFLVSTVEQEPLPTCSVAKEVIGVEIVEEAVEAARKNAELNGLSNCRFIAGDVLKVLESYRKTGYDHS